MIIHFWCAVPTVVWTILYSNLIKVVIKFIFCTVTHHHGIEWTPVGIKITVMHECCKNITFYSNSIGGGVCVSFSEYVCVCAVCMPTHFTKLL
jgi:hypothetical protein